MSEETLVHTMQLVVSVKSFLRMNSSEVGIAQKGSSLVLTGVLAYLGLQSGKLASVPYAMLSVAPLLGVPAGDATMKLLDRVTRG